ncbi:unnamed protein product [Calypogeia fissa]
MRVAQHPLDGFLDSVKGLGFYAAHLSTKLAEISTDSEGPMFADPQRNDEFRALSQRYKWKTKELGETPRAYQKKFKFKVNKLTNHFTTKGPTEAEQNSEDEVVEELAARHDMHSFNTVDWDDHFSQHRPENRSSSSFRSVINFIAEIMVTSFRSLFVQTRHVEIMHP